MCSPNRSKQITTEQLLTVLTATKKSRDAYVRGDDEEEENTENEKKETATRERERENDAESRDRLTYEHPDNHA